MEYASSIQAVAMRLTKLSAAGIPLVGAKNSFVTSQFSRVSFTPEYDAGEEISEKNAAGAQCVYYKIPDTLKKINLEIAICHPQPEITEFLAGGSLLTPSAGAAKTISNKALTSNVATLTTSAAHGFVVGQTVVVAGVTAPFDGTFVVTAVPSSTTFSYAVVNANVASAAATGTATLTPDAVGWASPQVGADIVSNGMGLEVWTRAIVNGRPSSLYPYWRFVYPSIQTRMTGDRVLENAGMANTFSGEGIGNLSFGGGPQNDLLFPGAAASAMYYVRDSAAPIGINDYQTVIA